MAEFDNALRIDLSNAGIGRTKNRQTGHIAFGTIGEFGLYGKLLPLSRASHGARTWQNLNFFNCRKIGEVVSHSLGQPLFDSPSGDTVAGEALAALMGHTGQAFEEYQAHVGIMGDRSAAKNIVGELLVIKYRIKPA